MTCVVAASFTPLVWNAEKYRWVGVRVLQADTCECVLVGSRTQFSLFSICHDEVTT